MRVLQIITVCLLGLTFVCNKTEEKIADLPEYAVVKTDQISVRTDPLTTASEIDFLDLGSKVRVLRRGEKPVAIGNAKDYWYLIQLDNGIEGWVYGANLSLTVSAPALEEIPDVKVVAERLVGKWWELRMDGSTGYRKIYFWPDGKYKYGFAANPMTEGKIEIDPKTRTVRLDPPCALGDRVSFKEVGEDYRLLVEKDGQRYVFRRGSTDPEATEVGKDKEDEKKPGQP